MASISRDKAIAAFGSQAAVPDWVWALAGECDRSSQGKAAKRLNVSPSMVNQALKGTYTGDTARLESKVRGEFMSQTVNCPVLGEISTRKCLDEQKRPFASTNPLRVAVYRACRSGCANFRGGKS